MAWCTMGDDFDSRFTATGRKKEVPAPGRNKILAPLL